MGTHLVKPAKQSNVTSAKPASLRSNKPVSNTLENLKKADDDAKIYMLQGLVKTYDQGLTPEFMAEVQRLSESANIGLRFWAKKVLNNYGFQIVEKKEATGGASLSVKQLLQKLETGKESSFVSLETIKKLCETKDPIVVPPLIDYLNKCSDVVQISYLTRQLGLNFACEPLLAVLAPFLESADDRIVANTIEGIEPIDSAKSVVHISRMLDHKSNRVRANAAKSLKKFDSEKTFAALAKMLEAKDKPHFVISACHAVKELKDELYVEYLAPLLEDELIWEHAHAALIAIGGEKAASIISASKRPAVEGSSKKAQHSFAAQTPKVQDAYKQAQGNYNKTSYDVFISHSTENHEIAKQICILLESHQINCWIAPRNINGGMEWADAIAEAIEECKVMIIILTEDSNKSEYVRREVNLATDFRKKIIPIRLGDLSISRGLNFYLSVSHWITCSEAMTDHDLCQILKSCRSLLNKENVNTSDSLVSAETQETIAEKVSTDKVSTVASQALTVAQTKAIVTESPSADNISSAPVAQIAKEVKETRDNAGNQVNFVLKDSQPGAENTDQSDLKTAESATQSDEKYPIEQLNSLASQLSRFIMSCFRLLTNFISSFTGLAAETKIFIKELELRLQQEPESTVVESIFRQAAEILPSAEVTNFDVVHEPASSRVEVNIKYEIDYALFSRKYLTAASFVLEKIAREKEKPVIALAGKDYDGGVLFRFRKDFPFRFLSGKTCERVVILETWRNGALDNLETKKFSVDSDTWRELSRLCGLRLLIQISFWDSEKNLVRREDYWPDPHDLLPLRGDASSPQLMLFSSLPGALTLSSFNAKKDRTFSIKYYRPKDELKNLHRVSCEIILCD